MYTMVLLCELVTVCQFFLILHFFVILVPIAMLSRLLSTVPCVGIDSSVTFSSQCYVAGIYHGCG